MIDERDYKDFAVNFEKASKSILLRDELKARVAEEVEKDMILLGSTGIEDML